MKKALNYLDKALLLAPKNLGLYLKVSQLQNEFRDVAELQKLQQRAKTAALDASSGLKEWQNFYSGTKDKEQLEKLQGTLVKTEEMLQSPEILQHPLTLERVKCRIIGLRQALIRFGGKTDADAQLAMARELQSANASSVAKHTLINALMFKAHNDLALRDAAYAALASKTRLSFSPQELLTLALERGGATANAIRSNQHVREAVTIIIAREKQFTSSPQSSEWALLREFDKAAAAEIAARFKASPLGRLGDDLALQLNPMDASSTLDEHWDLELDGDNTKAATILAEASARGIPMP